jgi:hypothetical protein
MSLSEVADKVIGLARKAYDYYAAELPRWHPNYPLVGPDDREPPPPPEEVELQSYLAALPEDLLYQLLVMYLGLHYFTTQDIAGAYKSLHGAFADKHQAVSEMMDMATLADVLSYGLEELRHHNINVDKLPLKKGVHMN